VGIIQGRALRPPTSHDMRNGKIPTRFLIALVEQENPLIGPHRILCRDSLEVPVGKVFLFPYFSGAIEKICALLQGSCKDPRLASP